MENILYPWWHLGSDFLKAINIDTRTEDLSKKGWNQLKMVLKGENWQALYTLINNGIITQEDQKMSI